MNRNPIHSTPVKKDDAAAMAAVLFDDFSSASTMRNILALYRSICDTIALRAAPINEFYPKLKSKIRSWKAQALWKKFDARASHKGTRTLGPTFSTFPRHFFVCLFSPQ